MPEPLTAAPDKLQVMTYRLTQTIPYFTGLPEDVVTNTFHFDFTGVGDPTALDLTALEVQIDTFYSAVYAGASVGGMGQYMRPLLATRKIFNLDDPTPRIPIRESATGLLVATATSTPLPTEVSLVTSFQGAPLSGTPQARRRGRIYLGGLGAGSTAGTGTTFPVPSAPFIAQVSAATDSLHANTLNNTEFEWVVWSPTSVASVPITNGWVDNAFDTQRRRGQQATGRTSWVG